MSRNAETTQLFADGEYVFRLGWGELIKLQEECDAGPFVILDRLTNGRWKVQEISATIRLGLIGAKIEPHKAIKMVKAWVEDRPPLENLVLAQVILGAAVVGTAEEVAEPPKKEEAASQENSSRTSPTESSDLPPSMPTEQ